MSTSSSNKDLVVETTHGPIRGRRCNSVYDDAYLSFEGIPYAQPPLGALRFRSPQPPPPWTEVRDCTKTPAKPPQKNSEDNTIEGSEDCLYLNVDTRQLHPPRPLPVMVFIHGGGFEKGDATRDSLGPDYFMARDVVLVTIGYRLGALGFLSLSRQDLQVPGNAGLKDQLMALQWIQRNAAHFGGDPENFTLFGASAGAVGVQLMMINPMAKGLFHRAILMSGSVLSCWAVSRVQRVALRLAQANGYKGSFDEDADQPAILEFLRSLPAEALVRPSLLTPQEVLDDCNFTYGPVIESYASDDCIVPQEPLQLLPTAWGHTLPLLVGGTSFEGLILHDKLRLAPSLLDETRQNPEHLLPVELKRSRPPERRRELASELKRLHFGDREIVLEQLLNYCDFASFKLFWHPVVRSLRIRLRHTTSTAPTFLYRFAFDAADINRQRLQTCGPRVRGAAHVDDIFYLFHGASSRKVGRESEEFATIQRMVGIWTEFAERGDPNCKELKGVAWPPLKPTSAADRCVLECLNIGSELQVMVMPEKEKLETWDRLYKEE